MNACLSQTPSGGYDPHAFATLFEAEDKHFWFRARNAVIEGLATSSLAGLEAPSILEIGCGNGNVLRVLNRICTRGLVVGLDFHAEGLSFAKRRCSVPLVQANANQSPFSVGFDLVGMFDVLEHIADDVAALEAARDQLRPGGTLLVTVPAHMNLWSYADDFAQHCRRFEVLELSEKLTTAGFEVDFISPFMMSLYPALRLWRSLNGGSSGTNVQQFNRDLTIIPVLNELAAWALGLEARWVGARRRLRFGASLVAVAVKPKQLRMSASSNLEPQTV
jgi:SAM-dependent methyltransferase